ncbi:MAG: hypothetical protein PHC87_00415 [Actinomycetota bacterium]|nr:hypothetical protein [Actinomycetota bacterium]
MSVCDGDVWCELVRDEPAGGESVWDGFVCDESNSSALTSVATVFKFSLGGVCAHLVIARMPSSESNFNIEDMLSVV